jgi:hypothetical protein
MSLQRPRQESDQRGEHRPASPVQPSPVQTRLRILLAQDGDLVAQDEDLHVLVAPVLAEHGQPTGDPAEQEVEQQVEQA